MVYKTVQEKYATTYIYNVLNLNKIFHYIHLLYIEIKKFLLYSHSVVLQTEIRAASTAYAHSF